MEVTMQAGEDSLNISQAIMLYSRGSRGSADMAEFASIHDVTHVETGSVVEPQIAAGRPITKDALLSLFSALGRNQFSNIELIPENVLSASADHIVWWMPSQKRRVFFETEELGNRTAIVPNPPLLFSVVGRHWSVAALEKNERPTAKSKIYFAPYFNVNDSGSICVGDARTPAILSTTTIGDWEKAFFESAFTHANGELKKIAHPDGEYSFWKRMLDGEYREFPMELLVSRRQILADVMNGIQKKLRGSNG